MAQQIPCQICGEAVPAQFLVSNTDGIEWIGYPPTVGACVGCFIRMGERLDEVLTAAMADHPAGEPDGPGVLEEVEADEGPQPVHIDRPGRRSRKSETPGGGEAAVAEETPAADVQR